MHGSSSSVTAPSTPTAVNGTALRWLFIATLFTSAGLLFMVQPMFGRMAMPVLGGAPAVWNVAMVFFQTTLLAGYFYAHVLSKLEFRLQLVIHVAVLAGAALMLPVQLDANQITPNTSMPTLWLLGLMIKTVGLPFFAISAQAPLMQRWFARSKDANAADPYFLYAASNIGSILGLTAYPAIMEPFFTVTSQASVWTLGFVLLLALVVCAGLMISRSSQATVSGQQAISQPIGWRRQLHWIVLAAVPSGLLLSVTNNITTDIAAVPLMWAPPLMAYLLSFVVAFATPKWLGYTTIRRLAPIFVIGLGLMGVFSSQLGVALSIFCQVFLFFAVALACHATLVAERPGADRLTQFYLLMSLGGAIGGAAVALLAPILFDWVFEQPILITISAFLLTKPKADLGNNRAAQILGGTRNTLLWDSVFALMAIVFALLVITNGATPGSITGYLLPVLLLIVLCFLARHRDMRFATVVGICSVAFSGWAQMNFAFSKEYQARSFFGIYRVGVSKRDQVRFISHGTTIHGAQSLVPKFRHEPQTYYVPESGIGRVMISTVAKNIGVVGLGSGALACYARPDQSWTFYEIDPLVVQIAHDTSLFTYLSDCAPKASMQVGDARLKLKLAQSSSYDMLVIDAFSSDSIPLHLITANAFDLYRSKLSPSGILMVHISNRYMDLQPVIGNIAHAQNWQAWMYKDMTAGEKKVIGRYGTASMWIMLTPTKAVADQQFSRMEGKSSGWVPLKPDETSRLWTDNYANTLSVLNWFK